MNIDFFKFSSIVLTLLTGEFFLANQPVPITPPNNLSLMELAESFCLNPDGDQELTWALAVRQGYRPLSAEEFPGLRLPGVRQLRGFTKRIGNMDVRILTAVNRYAFGPQLTGAGANFHLCWVSANNEDRERVDADLRDYLGIRRFRQGDAFAYAWTMAEDGSREGVRRSDFNTRFIETARDRGMRVAMSNEAFGWVSITYWRPVESFDERFD